MRLPAVAGRAAWGLGDQTLSSLTNFAVGIVVARSLGPRGFGAFSIAFALYLIVLSVARALASEPLVVRFSASAPEAWREAARRATGSSAVLGIAAGAGSAAAGFVFGGPTGAALLALSVCLPGLLVQDTWRFAFMARGTPRAALVNDALWALALIPLLGGMVVTGRTSVGLAVLGWGAAGTVAGVAGALQGRLVPRPLRLMAWWRSHRDLVPRFAGETVTLTAAVQGSLFGIGAVAGISAVGAFRGAQLLFSPVQLLLLASPLVAVPEAARAVHAGTDPRRIAVVVGAGLAAVAAALGAVLLVLPDRVGVWLLADTWPAVGPLLLPITGAVTAAGVVTGAHVALRALAAARHSLRARLVTQPLVLAAEVGGAVLAGALGAAWGSAAAMWLGATLWWRQLRVASAKGVRPGPVS